MKENGVDDVVEVVAAGIEDVVADAGVEVVVEKGNEKKEEDGMEESSASNELSTMSFDGFWESACRGGMPRRSLNLASC